MDKLKTYTKFRVADSMSAHVQNWGGKLGHAGKAVNTVKVRIPTLDGRKEMLLVPGAVIQTNDPRAVRALKGLFVESHIKVGGKPLFDRINVFETAEDDAQVVLDLDNVEVM